MEMKNENVSNSNLDGFLFQGKSVGNTPSSTYAYYQSWKSEGQEC